MPINFNYPSFNLESKTFEWKISSNDNRKIPTEWGFSIGFIFLIISYLIYAGEIMKSSSFESSFSQEAFYIFLPLVLIVVAGIFYFKRPLSKTDTVYSYKIDEKGITVNNFKYNTRKLYPWGIFKDFSKKNSEAGAWLGLFGSLEASLYGDIYFIFKKDSSFWTVNYISLKTTKDNSLQVENVISKYLPYKQYNPNLLLKEWELDVDNKLKNKLGIFYYRLVFMLLIVVGIMFLSIMVVGFYR